MPCCNGYYVHVIPQCAYVQQLFLLTSIEQMQISIAKMMAFAPAGQSGFGAIWQIFLGCGTLAGKH